MTVYRDFHEITTVETKSYDQLMQFSQKMYLHDLLLMLVLILNRHVLVTRSTHASECSCKKCGFHHAKIVGRFKLFVCISSPMARRRFGSERKPQK